ncbi:MAG: FAD:protein FMN transferase [Anaerovoracaceae bacterium]|nr:FAD:protein FMN transferase [Bacillota bacterium]MDY2671506.1 FAD:protein FMN transferase [Anaerovoracaceae bacterium]
MKKKKKISLILLAALTAASMFAFSACGSQEKASAGGSSAEPSTVSRTDDGAYSCDVFAMDTTMNIKAYGGRKAKQAVADAAEELYRLDSELSVVRKNSPVYELNARDIDTVSGDTAKVLSESLRLAESTGGAFDPTIYPIVKAWGFTTGKYKIPQDSEISELLTHVGYGKVSLAEGAGGTKVSFRDDKTQIDTGAIGKGYASQVIHDMFVKEGVKSAIATLGGNVMTVGSKTDGSSWTIAVEDPENTDNFAGYITLKDEFAVTSGGYQRFFKKDGKTYIHIMDPATGHPVENDLSSVTIISKSGTEADALSTALYVMGLDKAEEFWRTSDLDFGVIFIDDKGKLYVTEDIADRFSADSGSFETVKK